MKWIKKGLLFNAAQYGFDYSKSPQAIVFDHYVRIYFSYCIKDGNKLISQIGFVDFSKDFTKILQVSKEPVIARGKLGCFDEHGIFPFSPLRYKDKIYGFTSGWSRRQSVSVDTGIGLAISEDDGMTFQRIGDGPVLTATIYEPFLVIDGFVKIINNVFHMWYIYGTEWKVFNEGSEPDRIYKIGHAVSNDAIQWHKEGKQIISNKLEHEAQALPTVAHYNNRYHMYFCFREASDFRSNPSRGYRIGYAYSEDCVHWTRDDDNAGIDSSSSGWDSEMQCYPNLFEMDGSLYMLYNGNGFGKYGFGIAQLKNEV